MRAKTLQERITQFKEVHTDKYDYSLLVEPIRWDSKIPVICREHGVFHIMVNNHYRGAGCISCSGTKQKTRSQRIDDAVKVHGSKYDYSKLPSVVTGKMHVIIVCPKHGDFKCTLTNHITHKSGCPTCSNRKPRDYDKFIRQATTVHGDKYGYKFYDDVRRDEKITIVCPEHGEFEQTVGAHIVGKGCQACGSNSISMDEKTFLYILKGEGMFKVGITSRFNGRMDSLRYSTPFSFNVVHVKEFEKRSDALKSEKEILSIYDSAGLTGFDGATEWLLGDPCL